MHVKLNVPNHILLGQCPEELQSYLKPLLHGSDFLGLLVSSWGTRLVPSPRGFVNVINGFTDSSLYCAVTSKLFFQMTASSTLDHRTLNIYDSVQEPSSNEGFLDSANKEAVSWCVVGALRELQDTESTYLQLRRCSDSIASMTLSLDAMCDGDVFRNQVQKALKSRSNSLHFTYDVSKYSSLKEGFNGELVFYTAKSQLASAVEVRAFERDDFKGEAFEERAKFSENLTASQRSIVLELLEREAIMRLASDERKMLFKCLYSSAEMQNVALLSHSTLRQFEAFASRAKGNAFFEKISFIMQNLLPSSGITYFLIKDGSEGCEVVALNRSEIDDFDRQICFTAPKPLPVFSTLIESQLIVCFLKKCWPLPSQKARITLRYSVESMQSLDLFREETDRQIKALEEQPHLDRDKLQRGKNFCSKSCIFSGSDNGALDQRLRFDIELDQSIEDFCSNAICFFGLNDYAPYQIWVLRVNDLDLLESAACKYVRTISEGQHGVLKSSMMQYLESARTKALEASKFRHDLAS